ncbi:helix-turn-helix domain-containing protein [Enterococcus gallinarum]|uniref:helix-turn-helix domain-containing protein n=1 Tax=Enterococcus gallinarum TaxID=1353 RepID=UPI00214B07A3|nr:helix-turn-helix transcriptional regulator [Enterococcus gallinarum]MCR1931645.1 helix-turn-helix domain-containing protein [Enterococcus gallinarum]
MTTFERVKMLADKQKISIVELEERLNFSRNSLYAWKKSNPSIDKLQKVADYFNVSIDYLLGRDDKKYYELNDREIKDIGLEAERLLEGLRCDSEVSFYGEPMSEEEKTQMLTILELGLRMNKEKAKKKFTPKKYRDNK